MKKLFSKFIRAIKEMWDLASYPTPLALPPPPSWYEIARKREKLIKEGEALRVEVEKLRRLVKEIEAKQ